MFMPYKYKLQNLTKKLFSVISSATTGLRIIHTDLAPTKILSIHGFDHLATCRWLNLYPAIHLLHIYTAKRILAR